MTTTSPVPQCVLSAVLHLGLSDGLQGGGGSQVKSFLSVTAMISLAWVTWEFAGRIAKPLVSCSV